jgi:hypothetical protein
MRFRARPGHNQIRRRAWLNIRPERAECLLQLMGQAREGGGKQAVPECLRRGGSKFIPVIQIIQTGGKPLLKVAFPRGLAVSLSYIQLSSVVVRPGCSDLGLLPRRWAVAASALIDFLGLNQPVIPHPPPVDHCHPLSFTIQKHVKIMAHHLHLQYRFFGGHGL